MNSQKKYTILFVALCFCVLLLAGSVNFAASDNFGKKDQICHGVYVGKIYVGGLNKKEAYRKLYRASTNKAAGHVNIQICSHTMVTSLSALGINYDTDFMLQKALRIGKTGNLFYRLKQVHLAVQGKKNLSWMPEIDQKVLKKFILEKCSVYNRPVKNARLKFVHGKMKATKSHTGWEINVPKTFVIFKNRIKKTTNDKMPTLHAVVDITNPKDTHKEVAMCTDLLGSFSTAYNAGMIERSSNLANAVHYINGKMLQPDEVYSMVKTIKARTIKNGYKRAPEYSSGKIVTGIGGGVCQVATTLYNAVINAELKVVQRSPHSMVVSYVPVSRDAAISGNTKDFKFRNSSKYPVYIMGTVSGGIISFRIYGHETRPKKRTISFESEIIKTIQPGKAVETVDTSEPANYRLVTQPAHVGYMAKLWKIISIHGVEQKRVQLNTSTYNAVPEYVTVGKKLVSPKPANTQTPKQTAALPKQTAVSHKIQVTAKPSATKR